VSRFQAFEARVLAQFVRYRALRRDDESTNKLVAKRIDRTLHHRGGSLPYGKGADGPFGAGCRERGAHAPPPVHRGKGRAKEVQQETSARIDE
jgi:hypothetical protein